MRQASLQDLCQNIVARVDGALGCALVDLETGLPLTLEIKPGAPLNASSMELLSALGVSYFDRNPSMDLDDGSSEVDDVVQEIQTTTEDAYYFMARVPEQPHELLILITDPKTTNLGLGWMSMRQALEQIQALNADHDAGNGATGHARRVPDQPPQLSQERVFARRARNRRSIWD